MKSFRFLIVFFLGVIVVSVAAVSCAKKAADAGPTVGVSMRSAKF